MQFVRIRFLHEQISIILFIKNESYYFFRRPGDLLWRGIDHGFVFSNIIGLKADVLTEQEYIKHYLNQNIVICL